MGYKPLSQKFLSKVRHLMRISELIECTPCQNQDIHKPRNIYVNALLKYSDVYVYICNN